MFEIRPWVFLYVMWRRRSEFPFLVNGKMETLTKNSPFIPQFKMHKVWLTDYFYTYCLWPPCQLIIIMWSFRLFFCVTIIAFLISEVKNTDISTQAWYHMGDRRVTVLGHRDRIQQSETQVIVPKSLNYFCRKLHSRKGWVHHIRVS